MKSKTFVEPRWVAAIFFGIVFFVGGIVMLSFGIFGFFLNEFTIIIFGLAVFIIVLSIFSILLYVLYLLPKTFSLLNVSSKKIVWLCPFYRSVKMKLPDCEYLGVEDMADHNIAMPVIRGDEIAYIYLSTQPLPEIYRHKIDTARCKKGFIKFAYSDKLCQELISILPEEKTGALVSFYNRMQAADRANKLKQKKKKRKSKKK